MASHSRKKLARALVDMLDRHSVKDVARAAAQEISAEGRLRELDLLLKDISVELLDRQGHLEAGVTAAHDISDNLRQEVRSFLTNRYQAKTITLTENIDPAIIGGITLTTPREEIDASIKKQLTTLKHHN